MIRFERKARSGEACASLQVLVLNHVVFAQERLTGDMYRKSKNDLERE